MLQRGGFVLKKSLTNLFPKTTKQKLISHKERIKMTVGQMKPLFFYLRKYLSKDLLFVMIFLRDSFIICLVGQETDKDLISRIYIVLFTFILLRQVYLNSFVRDTKKIGQCMQERRKFIKKGDCFKKENRT